MSTPPPPTRPLIILGASARAAAASARRAGYSPWCIDMFADRDLREMATAFACPPGQYPHAMLERLPHAPAGAPVLLTGAMENHLDIVRAVEADHPLLTCDSVAIEVLRRPGLLADVKGIDGLRVPHSAMSAAEVRPGVAYLIKPTRSAGGHGIAPWRGQPLPSGCVLQQQVPRARSLGAVYSAAEGRVDLLGVTEQIIGRDAGDFRYCGSIGPVSAEAGPLVALGKWLADKTTLRGVFGIDLVEDAAGMLWPVEINPRYPAGCEILERAWACSVLAPAPLIHAAHAQSCMRWGKQIVWARHAATPGDLRDHFPRDQIADVPDPEQPLAAGDPVCTVLATDTTLAGVRDRLGKLAEAVHRALRPR